MAIAQGLEVRPQHDAVSDLTLTVLAAVAEFERAVIVESTLDGLAAARRAGKKLGRPLGKSAPSPERVAELRGGPHVAGDCAPPAVHRWLRAARPRSGPAEIGCAKRSRASVEEGPPKEGCRN